MFPDLFLSFNIAIFAAAAAAIGFSGGALTRRADIIADRTGLGEAMTGALLLGIATSLSGVVTSVTAAATGRPELAIANAIGGIAAQTMFLGVADLVYRRANLEHAAASETNLMQAALLIVLLSLALVAATAPTVTLWQIDIASPVLIGAYMAGVWLVQKNREEPMWTPLRTSDTRVEQPDEASAHGIRTPVLAAQMAGLIAVVGVAGWAIAQSGAQIAAHTGLSQTIVGALFAAVATSLPELVTTIAAVRAGSLQLAVGGIIGGNTFDVLFLAMSDAAYRDGSLFAAMEPRHLFLVALSILMTGLLLLGLVRRERHGPAGIGFESVLLLAVYAGGVAVQIAMG